MKIGAIVLTLRLSNTYFVNRIGGAAELDRALSGTLNTDMAFVVPMPEEAVPNKLDNSVQQDLTERFGVIVSIANDTDSKDITGLVAYDKLHDIRDELFSALVGLDLGYGGEISYRGGRILSVTNARLWYQFDFDSPALLKTDKDGYGELQYAPVDNRRKFEELDDFYKIANQYIFTPSVKWEDCEKILMTEGIHLPLEASLPDMEQMVDMSQQYKGGFDYGWGSGFDFYRVKTN